MTATSRSIVIEAMAKIARAMRGGTYEVLKRPVDWAAWPFDQKPKVISISCDQWNPFGDPAIAGGAQTGMFSLEIMWRRKDSDTDETDVDPNISDAIEADAVAIAEGVLESTVSSDDSDSVILRVERRSAQAVEVFDTALNIQGAIVTFRIDF